MIWSRIDIESWTVGLAFEGKVTLHLGPWKVSWIPKGSQIYRDFQRIKSKKS